MNRELHSEEEDEEDVNIAKAGTDDNGERHAEPLLYLLKDPARTPALNRESFDSDEEEEVALDRSGNQLGSGEMTEFEREWHYHPRPRDLANDVRVNRVFRTRNADFHNPDAEPLPWIPMRRRQMAPIK